jgi:hypothetical protein
MDKLFFKEDEFPFEVNSYQGMGRTLKNKINEHLKPIKNKVKSSTTALNIHKDNF